MPSPAEEKAARHMLKGLHKLAIEQYKTCQETERQALRVIYPELANVFKQLDKGDNNGR